MVFIIPSLDFFKAINGRLRSKNLSFLDTNMLVPPIYSEAKRSISDGALFGFLQDSVKVEKASAEIKKLRDFHKKYGQKLNQILEDHENVVTIDRVIIESENCAQYSDRKARSYRKHSRAGKRQGIGNKFNSLEKLSRQRSNLINSALNQLSNRQVYGEDHLGERELYNEVLSIVEDAGEKRQISKNTLNTDQHLVANAFYLSALEGKPIDVFTFDKHLPQLLETSYREVVKALPEEHGKLSVFVHRIGFKGEDYGIRTTAICDNIYAKNLKI